MAGYSGRALRDVVRRMLPNRRADELAAQLEQARAEFARTIARVNDVFWTVEVLPDGSATLVFTSSDASGVVGTDVPDGIDAVAARHTLCHPDDAEANAAFTAAIRAGEAAEVEERLVGFDGVTRWTWSRGTPRREGDRLFFDGITTNIDERHELAEQREELLRRERAQRLLLEEVERSRDDFVALAGHQLRTPLTVIQGYAEQLVDDPTMTDEQQAQLRVVVRRAELMSDLIEDLFDLAELDAPVEPVVFEPVRLDDLVLQRTRAHEEAARQTGIAFRVATEEAIVLGSRNRLDRMFDNVLGNSLKYSPTGSEVRVSVTREETHAVIRVADQGIGIPAQERPHVFDRLFRASNAVDGRFTGAGLGLSITLAIAEGHGGTVVVDEEPEGGAAILVRLPVHEPTAV